MKPSRRQRREALIQKCELRLRAIYMALGFANTQIKRDWCDRVLKIYDNRIAKLKAMR